MTIKYFAVVVMMMVGLAITSPLQAVDKKNQDTEIQDKADQIKGELLSNPDSMELIQKLKNDPNMQAILNDPELLQAVQEQDLARIAGDPKIKKLLENSNIKELAKKKQ